MGFRSNRKSFIRKSKWSSNDWGSATFSLSEKESQKFPLKDFSSKFTKDSLTLMDKHRIKNIIASLTQDKLMKLDLPTKIGQNLTVPVSRLPSIRIRRPLPYRQFSSIESLTDSVHFLSKRISSASTVEDTRELFKKFNFLHYRENVFRAASRLSKDLPPYPDWVYENEELHYQDIYKINVGGVIFFLFDDTLKNLIKTKLANCVRNHKNEGIPFFDRDHICFQAIINFYRTGYLHTPANICMELFEEELEFWGISPVFIEPCCSTKFTKFKIASNTLKKFAEDIKRTYVFENESKSSLMMWRKKIYIIMTKGSGSLLARWISTIGTICIVISILNIVLGSTSYGRVEIKTGKYIKFQENETVTHYYVHTKVTPYIEQIELYISSFFLFDITVRFILCPSRLEFLTDTLNWIDIVATFTTFLSITLVNIEDMGAFEGYILAFRLPRILRLFKLTVSLRSGMEAFVLTIKASLNEFKLMYVIFIMAASFFGTLLFVVEMLQENARESEKSKINHAFSGIWFAVVTMSTVGYGDRYPTSIPGQIITSCCILCGVIICQMPVPVFLQNFRVYHNQASARLTEKAKIVIKSEDPEAISDAKMNMERSAMKKRGQKKFTRLFNEI